MPRAPEFWARRCLAARLLAPLSWAYGVGGSLRRYRITPWRAPVPVICVGNLVAGGAGKTPVVLSLARHFTALGLAPHILSRGYGGSEAGPLRVDPAAHRVTDVGDEALLLAEAAPSWIARDRLAGARAAIAAGAGLLLLDDGFQNPALAKDLSLIVIDGGYGFGNGHLMPAGPLRERVASGLARADAVVLIGADASGIVPAIGGKPLLSAQLLAAGGEDLAGREVVAFAGIGRPEKLFATLEELGARLLGRHAFPDHHVYQEVELAKLCAEAMGAGAPLVTTAKDAVRLPPAWRAKMRILPVDIAWQDEGAMARLMHPLAKKAGGGA